MSRNPEKATWSTARLGGENRHTLYYGRVALGVIAPVGAAFFAQPYVEHRSKCLPSEAEAKDFLFGLFFPAVTEVSAPAEPLPSTLSAELIPA